MVTVYSTEKIAARNKRGRVKTKVVLGLTATTTASLIHKTAAPTNPAPSKTKVVPAKNEPTPRSFARRPLHVETHPHARHPDPAIHPLRAATIGASPMIAMETASPTLVTAALICAGRVPVEVAPNVCTLGSSAVGYASVAR
jgi:hypothetical protein